VTLESLGWNSFFAGEFAPYEQDNVIPARVAAQHRGAFVLFTTAGELWADAGGSLARAAVYPAVGDWVAVAPEEGARATIRAVLPRRTAFSRKAATGPTNRTEEQVLAANVDTVFLVSSFGPELNVRRLERYLTTAWESGADPVIVLTKLDLVAPAESEAAIAEVQAIALGVPVHALSSVTGAGLDALGPYFTAGRTIALLGSSGVGKSTLINRLVGEDVLATSAVRDDGRGRHTTAHRELVPLPSGALVLDTPGLRELQLWDAEVGLEKTFEDVAALAAGCRFSDCAHGAEPGCAIRAALADGSLDPARWASYEKLERELRALAVRQDARLASAEQRRWRAFQRARRRTKD
jgi:ribosome biogenesis GTPase